MILSNLMNTHEYIDDFIDEVNIDTGLVLCTLAQSHGLSWHLEPIYERQVHELVI